MTIDGAFVDYFSDDEYDMVFQDEIEPILERHGYSGPPAADDETPSRHCEVTSPGSRKFYANGIQTLCDAFAPLAENRVDSIRPLGTIGSICMTCHYLPACGGPKPCLPQPCSGLFPRRRRLKALIQKSVLNLSQDANLLPLSEG
jgi:hypothetical protein